MAVTLLRHGALARKYQKRYIGHSDIGLDMNAFDHAKAAVFKQQRFDTIYSSDLLRCTQTLQLLGFREFGMTAMLREVAFKDEIEMKSFDEIAQLQSFSQAFLKDEKTWLDYIAKESYEQFMDRIKAFLQQLDTDREVLLCTHKGVANAVCQMYGIERNHFDYLDWIRV